MRNHAGHTAAKCYRCYARDTPPRSHVCTRCAKEQAREEWTERHKETLDKLTQSPVSSEATKGNPDA